MFNASFLRLFQRTWLDTMYCAIAPPSAAQGILTSHPASNHLVGLHAQVGLVRVQSTSSSGSEGSFPHQSQTLHGTSAKYTVIGAEDLAAHLANERAKSKKSELGVNYERRTRADRQQCESPSSAPPSILSAYHSSSSSSGNSSPTSFYSLPNQDILASHLHANGRPESPAVCAVPIQHRPSTRYHRPNGDTTPASVHNSTSVQRSMFLNWKNNNVVPSAQSNPRKCNEAQMEKPNTYLKPEQVKKPQVPPKCEKVIEMLKSKARKGGKSKAEMNMKNNNCRPQGAAAESATKQTGANTNQTKDSAIEQNAKKSFLETYDVLGVIGVGGGGMVYAGTRTIDNHPVAIKRIMREKVKRWERIHGRTVPQEIALMIRVNGHQGIIRLLDWYECLDSFILILERPASSVDLFDYIREVGRMNEREACMIFRQILTAVYHVHSRGVVHRDIKDENIVLNRDTGEAKLIDFGCGTLIHEHPYRDFSGTPEFYPPEWFNEHYYNARTAAVWSLGVLLYDMLCGEIPFKSKTKIAQGKFDFKGTVSSEAKHLITWMLSFRPESRPSVVDIMQHPWIVGKKF